MVNCYVLVSPATCVCPSMKPVDAAEPTKLINKLITYMHVLMRTS